MLISFAGILLIAIVLLDVFLTVLDANGYSLVSSRAYRWFWWVWRHFTRILPPSSAHATLSLGAPLMIPLMIGLWTLGLVTGFALVYFGGLSPQDFLTGGGSQPSLSGAFRLSWVTLSTIGFVEISPSNMPYSLTVALEAILGSIVLTFTITYFLSVHQVVISYNKLATTLQHRTADITRPLSGVGAYFNDGQYSGLEGWLGTLHEGVAMLHEGLRRYPIVYYFRPRRRFRGLPHTLAAFRAITSNLLWCVESSHPVRSSPNLTALRRGLEDLMGDLEDRYVPVNKRSIARAVSYGDFEAAFYERRFAPDRWVDRFLRECDEARAITGSNGRDNPVDAYQRYGEWLPFVVRLGDFEASIRADLGYSERLRPGRSSSIWSVLSRGPKDGPQALVRSGEDRS